MTTPAGYHAACARLTRRGEPFVSVTLVAVQGSTPQDAGSKMIVSAGGLLVGTVGGGRIERRAIETAGEMLRDPTGGPTTQLVRWNLQTDVGMTCGGTVTLYFEVTNHRRWPVVVFGAGHVANRLVRLLCKLDCRITCVDPRQEWLDRLPRSMRLEPVCMNDMPHYVQQLGDDAFVLCLTMGHRTDRPILEEIFRQNRRFPYLGVIGSRAKRSVLKRELIQAGVPPDRAEAFRCPIGLSIGTNQPQEIAISIAAQLIQRRDEVRGAARTPDASHVALRENLPNDSATGIDAAGH